MDREQQAEVYKEIRYQSALWYAFGRSDAGGDEPAARAPFAFAGDHAKDAYEYRMEQRTSLPSVEGAYKAWTAPKV